MIKQKFIINIKDQDIELEREEAEELYEELKSIFDIKPQKVSKFDDSDVIKNTNNKIMTPEEIKNSVGNMLKTTQKGHISQDFKKQLKEKLNIKL